MTTPSVKRNIKRQGPIGMHCDTPKWIPDPFPSVMASVTRPVITSLKRSLGQGNFLHLFFILFTVHAGIPPTPPPPGRHPLEETPQKETLRGGDRPGGDPQEKTPQGGTPPPQSMLGDTVNAWEVRILLECNLVYNV